MGFGRVWWDLVGFGGIRRGFMLLDVVCWGSVMGFGVAWWELKGLWRVFGGVFSGVWWDLMGV